MGRLFDREVSYRGTRRTSSGATRTFRFSALRACVLDGGFDDPIGEGSTASRRRAYTIIIKGADWPDTTPPQTGDTLTLDDGQTLKVKALNLHVGRDPMVEARTC